MYIFSFSDGGKYTQSIESSITQVKRMLSEGATIIDIGGESTRPGAREILLQEEIDRVVPVIRYKSSSFMLVHIVNLLADHRVVTVMFINM